MPIIAVVAAVFEVAAVAEVGFAAATALQIVTAIGSVVGAVGAVTGNKDLMRIGAVTGLVGAVGSFASGEGLLGFGKSAPDSASTMISNPTGDAGYAGGPTGFDGDATDALTGSGTGSSTGSGMVNASTSPATPAASTDIADTTPPPDATVNPPPLANPTTPLAAPVTPSAGAPNPTDVLPNTTPASSFNPPPNNAASGTYTDSSGAPGAAVSNTLNPLAPPSTFDNLMSTFRGVGTYMNNNKNLTSSLLAGVASAADPSQRGLRNAQAANYSANTAHTNQLTQNMNGVGGLINWSKVFQPTGLIGKGN